MIRAGDRTCCCAVTRNGYETGRLGSKLTPVTSRTGSSQCCSSQHMTRRQSGGAKEFFCTVQGLGPVNKQSGGPKGPQGEGEVLFDRSHAAWRNREKPGATSAGRCGQSRPKRESDLAITDVGRGLKLKLASEDLHRWDTGRIIEKPSNYLFCSSARYNVAPVCKAE